jgi:hypothetical protein
MVGLDAAKILRALGVERIDSRQLSVTVSCAGLTRQIDADQGSYARAGSLSHHRFVPIDSVHESRVRRFTEHAEVMYSA